MVEVVKIGTVPLKGPVVGIACKNCMAVLRVRPDDCGVFRSHGADWSFCVDCPCCNAQLLLGQNTFTTKETP